MSETQKALTLSIIIPAYNEEDYLAGCLDSIAGQTITPLEVIVVDNNSTDSTTDIAKRYDFVKVVHETRQHQAYAQHTGFAVAKGDIIGRIDADTILPVDWVEKNLKFFQAHPKTVAAAGRGVAYDIVLKRFGELLFNFYYRIAYIFAGHKLMWGANCAFRKSAWPKIKDELLLRPDIWEDYDLGFCLAGYGRIENIDNRVGVSYRAVHRPLLKQISYQTRSIKTFYIRKGMFITAGFTLAWSTAVLLAPVIAFDHYILRPARDIAPIRMLMSRLAYLIDI
ncbi:MAG TPA: glycosyltransferase family A protein [Candidatus Saccharimonadales bacterium]|nr:glycosyltransferase family A protein [Candidatus Saccharimonadales bacterium]